MSEVQQAATRRVSALVRLQQLSCVHGIAIVAVVASAATAIPGVDPHAHGRVPADCTCSWCTHSGPGNRRRRRSNWDAAVRALLATQAVRGAGVVVVARGRIGRVTARVRAGIAGVGRALVRVVAIRGDHATARPRRVHAGTVGGAGVGRAGDAVVAIGGGGAAPGGGTCGTRPHRRRSCRCVHNWCRRHVSPGGAGLLDLRLLRLAQASGL